MSRLVLINGAPGAGKSTLAGALAQDRPLTLQVDVDAVKHSLTGWDERPSLSGRHARRLSLALADEQLAAGYDVVIGQYLVRPEFIEELAVLTRKRGARFCEVILTVDVPTLTERLTRRATAPDRPEHDVNNRLVGPDDASQLVASMEALRDRRPDAVWVDARGSKGSVLSRIRAALE